MDPERRKQQRAYQNRYYHTVQKLDPEFRQKLRDRSAAHYEKHKHEPEFVQKRRDNARRWYQLQRQRTFGVDKKESKLIHMDSIQDTSKPEQPKKPKKKPVTQLFEGAKKKTKDPELSGLKVKELRLLAKQLKPRVPGSNKFNKTQLVDLITSFNQT